MMVRSLLIACFLFFMGNIAMMAQDFDYVGAKKCKMCHNKPATGAQYKIWSEGPHANAMASLKGEEASDPKCLKCHSTAATANPDLIAGLKADEGVSCESCHGAGGSYFPNAVMKDREKSIEKGLIVPTEQTCTKCHNDESPTFKGFNYEEYLKKIAHPNPAKE